MPTASGRHNPYAADPTLLGRLAQRECAAQEQVWRAERERLLAIARRALRSPEHAEALVADVLHDFLFHYVDRVREAPAIPAYLRVMTVRRARRHDERRARLDSLETDPAIADSAAPPDDELDRDLWLDWLRRCLGRLTERTRAALRLHYGHDLSYATIGAAQGRSKQAVGKAVFKSLEALRTCVEAQQKTQPQRSLS